MKARLGGSRVKADACTWIRPALRVFFNLPCRRSAANVKNSLWFLHRHFISDSRVANNGRV